MKRPGFPLHRHRHLVAQVAVELDAETLRQDVVMIELRVVLIVGEHQQHAAILHPLLNHVGIGRGDVIGLAIGGSFFGAGVDDDVDRQLVQIGAGGEPPGERKRGWWRRNG